MTMRAFTLIEIVIVTALAALLMGALSYLYVGYGRAFPAVGSSLAVTEGASAILEATRTAALQATDIVASHSFSGTTYASGTTTAVFELPAITAAGVVVLGAYDYIGIHASGTMAYRLTDAAAGSARISGTRTLTNILDTLTFTYDNANVAEATSVFVEATTSAVIRDAVVDTHVRTHVYLRNL